MRYSYSMLFPFAAFSLLSVKVPGGVSPVIFYISSLFIAVFLTLLIWGCIRFVRFRVFASALFAVVLAIEFGSIIVNGFSYFGFV